MVVAIVSTDNDNGWQEIVLDENNPYTELVDIYEATVLVKLCKDVDEAFAFFVEERRKNPGWLDGLDEEDE